MLYSGESGAAENLKLVRVARELRASKITNLQSHISVVGYMSSGVLLLPEETREKERYTIEALMWEKREKLVQLGVPENAILVYVPFQLLPVAGRAIQIASHDGPPKPAATQLPGSAPEMQPFNPSVSSSIIVDPIVKREESQRTHRTVETQIEVAIIDDKNNKRIIASKVSVTMNIGPNGFEEVGAELTFLKIKAKDLKLREKLFWGTVTNVSFSLKIATTLSLDKNTAQRVIGEWATKFKATLAADLNVPKTSVKIPVEASFYTDTAGAPGVAVQITVFEF